MSVPPLITRPLSMMRAFLAAEAAGGIILIAAAALGMLVANSALSADYFHTLHIDLAGLSLLHWINDGLMALFFLIVGLEIKREVLDGQLARWPDRLLPGLAAAAGVIMPALIYVAINRGDATGLRGWAIPAATDIAFALGVLALLGPRVPGSLKIFLAAVAIIDDLIAVLIIALFYSGQLSLLPLALAVAGLACLALCNRAGVNSLWPYILIGLFVWFCVLQSGIHATLAGVAVAMTMPLRKTPAAPDDQHSPLSRLEHGLHPWVAYAIVPLFGFANAGVSLSGVAPSDLAQPVPLGIALGLFAGKQLGIFGTIWLLSRLGWASRPAHSTWTQVYGVALLCGIGFTMSLFIGGLAFAPHPDTGDAAKLGILLGSLASATAGFLILRLAPGLIRTERTY
ncbi:Na+/H+ antiporter NhaA [Sphingobium sp. Cam5-1]|uniref:Na+/H+ antiporter NhaA n=1 Tax=Sphingobium sp. Cam5-1 TaxID=2789327 RepID=UPI0018AD24B2|nr:Na+/H+ antiporter NhaA [Sphingobium sp. Cam5-1]QPI73271.1 Na+/H+ antiporter NhaA [Sphingobium sp. Cam5-1]